MEKAVAEMFNWIMTGVIIVAVLTIGMLLYFTNQRTAFINQTQQIIQRTGNLSQDTINDIDKLSDDNYQGMFTVVNPDDPTNVSGDVSYGETIKYAVTTKLPLIGFTIDKIQYNNKANWKTEKVVSEIRKGSMEYKSKAPKSTKHEEIRQKIKQNKNY